MTRMTTHGIESNKLKGAGRKTQRTLGHHVTVDTQLKSTYCTLANRCLMVTECKWCKRLRYFGK